MPVRNSDNHSDFAQIGALDDEVYRAFRLVGVVFLIFVWPTENVAKFPLSGGVRALLASSAG